MKILDLSEQGWNGLFPISEGVLMAWVEIIGGDTKLLYAMKLMLSKDIQSTIHLDTIHKKYYP